MVRYSGRVGVARPNKLSPPLPVVTTSKAPTNCNTVRSNGPVATYNAKLIVNFSHESDVTSLDPFLFYYCVPHKYEEAFSYKPNADTSHLLDSLVSALAVYATAFRSRLSLG